MRIARFESHESGVVFAVHMNGQWRRHGMEAEGFALPDMGATISSPVTPKRWLPPIEPRAILCIGKNYAAHAAEFDANVPDYPVLFMKNPAAALGHEESIRIPDVCGDEVDYEGELAVVIGQAARDVPPESALDYVFGFCCANDVSARIWQKEKGGSQWNRGKSFDTFAPLGPWLVTPDEVDNVQALTLTTRLNGKEMQRGETKLMLFPVARLISFLSQGTTLLPGTVILTGTPEGVGWARSPKVTLSPGDVVEVDIGGIGILRNRIAQ